VRNHFVTCETAYERIAQVPNLLAAKHSAGCKPIAQIMPLHHLGKQLGFESKALFGKCRLTVKKVSHSQPRAPASRPCGKESPAQHVFDACIA